MREGGRVHAALPLGLCFLRFYAIRHKTISDYFIALPLENLTIRHCTHEELLNDSLITIKVEHFKRSK